MLSSAHGHTLYVGNLPFKISDEELAAHFASAGEVVEVTHVRERGSDRSNGVGSSKWLMPRELNRLWSVGWLGTGRPHAHRGFGPALKKFPGFMIPLGSRASFTA